jgi:hypothetical protein
MSPEIRTRALIGAAIVVLSSVVAVHPSSADPCDDTRARRGAADAGWQVQVDPDTGVYTMPAPRPLDETGARTAATAEVVITPGRSAAGGFKATFGDDTLVQEQAKEQAK